MAQQRRFSRLPFPTASTLTVGTSGRAYETDLIDLSLKGALVHRPSALEEVVPGAPAVLSVHLEDSPVVITMKGTVAHLSAERLGLHCLSIDVDSITHLRRLMELNLGDPGLLERELLALG
ncbi:MAG TPA: PilZ domain-containing protein [bacterium]|nr:PilZ domain-containing protein [bacterium]